MGALTVQRQTISKRELAAALNQALDHSEQCVGVIRFFDWQIERRAPEPGECNWRIRFWVGHELHVQRCQRAVEDRLHDLQQRFDINE